MDELAERGLKNRPDLCRFYLLHVPDFPTDQISLRVGRPPADEHPWLLRLRDNIAEHGFRQPLCVYGHLEHNGPLQPRWIVKVGANRLWCAQSLQLPTVPVLVTSLTLKDVPGTWTKVDPFQLQDYFVEGRAWADETGFGVVGVNQPEIEFAT